MADDKCASHDDCIGRLHDTVEAFNRKLDSVATEIRDSLHQGEILHTKVLLRLDHCEADIKELRVDLEDEIGDLRSGHGGIDWKGNMVRLAFGLAEKGAIVIIAMAWYGSRHGWGMN